MELQNKKWTEDQFNEYLEKVRSWYPTGREVDMDEAVEYHKNMPEHRNLFKVWSKAEAEGNVLVLPRAGFATIEQTLETHVYARDHGGADLVRVSTDTYTRRMDFDKAEKALEERDYETEAHVKRMKNMATALGREMGLPEEMRIKLSDFKPDEMKRDSFCEYKVLGFYKKLF